MLVRRRARLGKHARDRRPLPALPAYLKRLGTKN
jgi:hypothetical protein